MQVTKTSYIFLFIGLVSGVSAMATYCKLSYPADTQPPLQEIRNKQDYKYINPLLECDSSIGDQNKYFSVLKKELENTINQQIQSKNISFASVYFRDLNNGPWIGIKEKEFFSPASLIKVPVMMAYYKLAESDPTILQKQLVNKRSYNPEEQNITPEITLVADQSYTVDDLINKMIIYSDNLSYELLVDNIDNNLIYKIYSDLGVDISQAYSQPNGNILSVREYASFFRVLFNSSYLDKDMSEKALKLLTQVKYKKALVAGIPRDVEISHKFGERQYLDTGEKQLHDCGIIYAAQKPYLLCVMTRGNNFDHAANTIKTISTQVYKHVTNNQ